MQHEEPNMLPNVAIKSTGLYVPEIELTNDAIRARIPQEREAIDKLEAASGIKTRFVAPPEWATSDLAVRAGRQALSRAGVSPEDIDLIVVGTDSPDYITPSTSVIVQHKIGAPKAGTFDVGCACASFPTALSAARGLMGANAWMKNVLVIGAYRMSKLADPEDVMSFFYGDGAGAALLQRSDSPGILGTAFRADGSLAKHWMIPSGGTAEPASHDAIDRGRTNVRMYEKYPPEVNDEGWPALVRTLSQREGFRLTDIDLVVFTQVRKRTIEKVMKTLALPMEKTHTIMEKWGYTGSACIPMALHDAVVSGRVKKGDLVVMVGSGVGYNQAAVAVRITDALVR
jgi:3-oxoacyl-[acyl-carrier-protein] synthase-3